MQSHDNFLNNVDLKPHEWRGLNDLSKAMSSFEPLAKRAKLGKVIAERLVDYGLAEIGESDRYPRETFGPGYRLTELGWKVLERGQWAPRQRLTPLKRP